jgi:hypothetical protein
MPSPAQLLQQALSQSGCDADAFSRYLTPSANAASPISSYSIHPPLDIVFTPALMRKYSAVFVFRHRLNLAILRLGGLWNLCVRGLRKESEATSRPLFLFLQQLIQFFSVLCEHVSLQMAEALQRFQERWSKETKLCDLERLHSHFLDSILERHVLICTTVHFSPLVTVSLFLFLR